VLPDSRPPLPFAAQAIPSLPEILPFAVLCPAGLFISENDTPPRIPVDNHCEAAQHSDIPNRKICQTGNHARMQRHHPSMTILGPPKKIASPVGSTSCHSN